MSEPLAASLDSWTWGVERRGTAAARDRAGSGLNFLGQGLGRFGLRPSRLGGVEGLEWSDGSYTEEGPQGHTEEHTAKGALRVKLGLTTNSSNGRKAR